MKKCINNLEDLINKVNMLKEENKNLRRGYKMQDSIIKQLEISNQQLPDRIVKAEGMMQEHVWSDKF